jgi:hypothetical protein
LSLRRTNAFLVALVLVGAAACGGGGSKQTGSSSSTSGGSTTKGATTTAAPPVVAPLTGLPFTNPNQVGLPALVVKIDNADGRGSNARPQIGLNQADVVYEEEVEGSVTRLAAIFHSQGSDPVGPVRSARTTDISVFSPLNRPLFAWSGANADFARFIRSSPLIDVGFDTHSGAYTRRNVGGHVAPHNLYSSTSSLWALTPPGSVPPSPLFIYRPAGVVGNGARPVGSIHILFGGGPGSAPVDWSWNAAVGAFVRNQRGTPHVDESGAQISAQNVVVLHVPYVNTGYVDVSGSPVPEAQLVGTGHCWILSAGQLVEGTWTKTAPEAITTYTDATGAPIGLQPGRTWVELAPIGGASVTG